MIGGSMKKIAKLFGVLIGTAFLVFVLDIGCIFRTLTGFPCMGCGVTRAFLAFLQGHVVDAFYYHPLFWLTGILIVLALWKDGKVFRSAKANRWFWIIVLLVYLSVYIVRMVLLFPDTPPMDYNYEAPAYHLYQYILELFTKSS